MGHGVSAVKGILPYDPFDNKQSYVASKMRKNYRLAMTLIPDRPDRYSNEKKYDKFRALPQVTVPVWTFDVARYASVLAAAVGNTVHLWDLFETQAELRVSLTGHTDQVWAVKFSSNESELASGSNDKTVRLWQTVTGMPLRTFEGHDAGIRCLSFSDTGLLVSGGMDEQLMLWEYTHDLATCIWKGHEGNVHDVAFFRTENHPDVFGNEFEKRYFGANRKIIRDSRLMIDDGWSGEVGADRGMWFEDDKFAVQLGDKIWVAHFSAVGAMTCELDIGSEPSKAGKVLQKLARKKEKPALVKLEDFRSKVVNAQPFKFEEWRDVLPQTLASVGADGSIALWQCSPGRADFYGRFAGGDGGGVLCVAVHPRNVGIVAAGNQDGAAWVWFVKPPHPPMLREFFVSGHKKLYGHKQPVWTVAFSPNGSFLATGSSDNTVRIWHVTDGVKELEFPKQVAVFNAHESWVRHLRFVSPGTGHNLVTCSTDGSVKVWTPHPNMDATVNKEKKTEEKGWRRTIEAQRALEDLDFFAGRKDVRLKYNVTVVEVAPDKPLRAEQLRGTDLPWDEFARICVEDKEEPDREPMPQEAYRCTVKIDGVEYEAKGMGIVIKTAQELAVLDMLRFLNSKGLLKAARTQAADEAAKVALPAPGGSGSAASKGRAITSGGRDSPSRGQVALVD